MLAVVPLNRIGTPDCVLNLTGCCWPDCDGSAAVSR